MLRGDPDTPKFKEAMAVLDQSGLGYRIIHDLRAHGQTAPLIVWGEETLGGFFSRAACGLPMGARRQV